MMLKTAMAYNFILLDVLHQLELSTGCVNLGDRSRCQFVDKLTKDLAITKSVLVRSLEFLTQNCFDPFLSFTFLFGVALGENLNEIIQGVRKCWPDKNKCSNKLSDMYLGLNLSLQHFSCSFWVKSRDAQQWGYERVSSRNLKAHQLMIARRGAIT